MASLKPGFEVEPKNPVPITFRPHESVIHRVSDGEDWHRVAKRYNTPVDELIYSNFKTNVPREINWYLREYIRCDLPTADRKNWRFSTSARFGGGPRPGVVYVQLNWAAILEAAKRATRQFVSDWFRMASLGPQATLVTGPMLTVFPGAVQTPVTVRWPFADQFKATLVEAGAPENLAQNWLEILVQGLVVFTMTLETTVAAAFPTLSAGSQFPGPHLSVPFPLLLNGNDGMLTHDQFRLILTLSDIEGTAARRAIRAYSAWFDQSFFIFRSNHPATNVQAMVAPFPDDFLPQGTAIAPPGFLGGPGMTF